MSYESLAPKVRLRSSEEFGGIVEAKNAENPAEARSLADRGGRAASHGGRLAPPCRPTEPGLAHRSERPFANPRPSILGGIPGP